MTKNELSKQVSKTTGFTNDDVSIVIDTLFECIKNTLYAGEEVSIHGFGKIKIIEKQERIGSHPQTKEPMIIPAHTTLKFEFSDNLKKMMR